MAAAHGEDNPQPAAATQRDEEWSSDDDNDDTADVDAPSGYRPLAAAASASDSDDGDHDSADTAAAAETISPFDEAMLAMRGGGLDLDADGTAELVAAASAAQAAMRIREGTDLRVSPVPPPAVAADDFALPDDATETIRIAMAQFALPRDAIPSWARDRNGDETDAWQETLTLYLAVRGKAGTDNPLPDAAR